MSRNRSRVLFDAAPSVPMLSFAPVIMSAVTATTLSRLVYGSEQVFSIPPMQLESLLELPYVMLMGITLGCIAALFIHLLQRSTTLSKRWPIWIRCTLGGGIVGIIGMVVPEVMGIGYDTVNQALLGQLALSGLLLITAAKIIASALGLGLGLLICGAALWWRWRTRSQAATPGSEPT